MTHQISCNSLTMIIGSRGLCEGLYIKSTKVYIYHHDIRINQGMNIMSTLSQLTLHFLHQHDVVHATTNLMSSKVIKIKGQCVKISHFFTGK